MMSPCGIEIKVGQVWQEVDPRLHREVVVVSIDPVWINKNGSLGMVTISPYGLKSMYTKARLERFNGKRSGYKLVKEDGK